MIVDFLVTSLDGVTRAYDDRGVFQRAGSVAGMLRRYPDIQHIVMGDEEPQGVHVARANAKAMEDKLAAHAALVEAEARAETEREPADPYADPYANPEKIAVGDIVSAPGFGGRCPGLYRVAVDTPEHGGVVLDFENGRQAGVGYSEVRLIRRAAERTS